MVFHLSSLNSLDPLTFLVFPIVFWPGHGCEYSRGLFYIFRAGMLGYLHPGTQIIALVWTDCSFNIKDFDMVLRGTYGYSIIGLIKAL